MAHTWEMLDSQLASSLLYLFLFALFLFIWFHPKLSSKKLQAPSPPRLPIIGNLHQLGSYPHRALAALAQRHGPLMMLRLGSAPTFVVSTGKVVEEMVKKHDIAFSNRHDSTIYRRLMYDCKDLLLAPYGEYWRQMRGVCFSQLLSPKMVQSLQYLREQETNLLMEKIKGFNTTPFDLSHLFEYLTKDIVYIATLGKRFSEGQSTEDKLTRLFVEFNALLGLFNVGDYIPWLSWINHFNGLNERIENNHREINELLEEVIDDQLARRTNNNNEAKEKVLLDALLDAQNGDSVTRDSAKAVILDVFAGGIDTVFVVLEWVMTELIRNPEILKRTQQQIREIVGRQNQITKHDISKMTYLKAVIKESMRMHPPFPLIPRVSNQELELYGYTIPNKTRLLINIYAVGRDPECWEEPDTFKPERFMNDGALIEYNSNDYSWMAFGAGRRGCPGGLFGMTLIEFVIASLLQNFNWSFPDGKTEKDVDMDEFVALALHKLQPLIAVATPNPDI